MIADARHGAGGAHREHPDARPRRVIADRPRPARPSTARRTATATATASARHEGGYLRYELTETASRRWPCPGRRAASTWPPAWSTTRTAARAPIRATTRTMTDKRFRKLAPCPQDAPGADYYGDPTRRDRHHHLGLARPVVEAIDLAAAEGIRVAGDGAEACSGRCRPADRAVHARQARGPGRRGELQRAVRAAPGGALPASFGRSTSTAAEAFSVATSWR